MLSTIVRDDLGLNSSILKLFILLNLDGKSEGIMSKHKNSVPGSISGSAYHSTPKMMDSVDEHDKSATIKRNRSVLGSGSYRFLTWS